MTGFIKYWCYIINVHLHCIIAIDDDAVVDAAIFNLHCIIDIDDVAVADKAIIVVRSRW